MELKEGYKNTEIGVIPKDWEVDEIGNNCTIFGRIGYRGYTVNDIVEENYGAITISPSNINNNKIGFKKSTYISWYKYNESPEIKIYNGDILLVKTGSTTGKTALVKNLNQKATINPQLVVLKKIAIDNVYLSYLMSFTLIQNQIKSTIVGGAIPTLSQKEVASYKIPLPPLPEQTAIASILSDTDSLIQALEKKIAKKQLIKKGAMQKLLSPNPDGNQEGWVVKSLGEILKVNHGKDQKSIENKNGRFPILGTGGLMGFTNYYLYDKESVLIGRKGTIDKPQYMDTPFWTVDTLFYTEIFEGYSAKFIFYAFNLIDWYSYNEASGVPSLNARTIEKIEIPFPSKKEQTLIAKILSDMDTEIENLEKQLAKYKQIKQGLMQVLLTGKIRLE